MNYESVTMVSTSEDKALFDRLERKHGPGFVQDIQDRLTLWQKRDIQYLEMKQMQDILNRFRNRVRANIKHYRRWKADYESEKDQIEKVYKAYDGIFVRRQIKDAWRLYVMVNKDYHDMRRTYLSSFSRYNPHSRNAA